MYIAQLSRKKPLHAFENSRADIQTKSESWTERGKWFTSVLDDNFPYTEAEFR